jgi:coenzyme A diphosphatase NUDT7
MISIELLRSKLPAHPGIHSEDEYINTAVLVLLILSNREYHFVFQKRGPHIRQGGEICFPGGLCRPQDGTPQQTAVRETVEEMGIPAEKLTVIGPLDTVVAPLGVSVKTFVGVADIASLDEIKPNRDEVEHVFSIPVSYFENHEPQKYNALLKVHPTTVDEKTGKEIVLFPARELGLPERYAQPWGSMKHPIYVYRLEQGIIWGLTARIIVGVINKLKG